MDVRRRSGDFEVRREAGVVEVCGLLRPAPGAAAQLAAGLGAAAFVASPLWSSPAAFGLGALAGGLLGVLGLRRLLEGSLEHETRFSAAGVERTESGSQTPRRVRFFRPEELRCLGLTLVEAGGLGSGRWLHVVLGDRGLLLVGRESGPEVRLPGLASELSRLTGIALEEHRGWPRHEWPASARRSDAE
jgi:hypothetical protein